MLKPRTTLTVDFWTATQSEEQTKLIQAHHLAAHLHNATKCADCEWKRWIGFLHKCLYCGLWFCPACAEKHFGQTIQDYRTEKRITARKAAQKKRSCPMTAQP